MVNNCCLSLALQIPLGVTVSWLPFDCAFQLHTYKRRGARGIQFCPMPLYAGDTKKSFYNNLLPPQQIKRKAQLFLLLGTFLLLLDFSWRQRVKIGIPPPHMKPEMVLSVLLQTPLPQDCTTSFSGLGRSECIQWSLPSMFFPMWGTNEM